MTKDEMKEKMQLEKSSDEEVIQAYWRAYNAAEALEALRHEVCVLLGLTDDDRDEDVVQELRETLCQLLDLISDSVFDTDIAEALCEARKR